MRTFGGTGCKKKGCVQRQYNISNSDVSMTTYKCNYDGLQTYIETCIHYCCNGKMYTLVISMS